MQTITTKFLGATNTKGERVKATSSSGISVTIPWSYSGRTIECHFEAVKALCDKLNWEATFISGEHKCGYVWVFADSEKMTYSKIA
jgi:hypothetical protein